VTRIDIGISPVTPTNGGFEFLQINDQNVALNGVGIPTSVTYGGVTWSMSYNAGTLSLKSNTVPNDALAAQALLRNLRYINTSAGAVNANDPDRVFDITVYDRVGNASNTARVTVATDATGPVIDLNGNSAGVDNAVSTLTGLSAVNAGVLLQSADNTATLVEDRGVNWLQVAAQGVMDGAAELLVVGTTNLRLDGVGVTGATAILVNTANWLASFVADQGWRFALANGSTATATQAQDLLRAMSYKNTASALANLTDGARVLTVSAQDSGGNLTATPAKATMLVNVAPPQIGAGTPLVTIDGDGDGVKGDQFTVSFSELVDVSKVANTANWAVSGGLGIGATITAVNPVTLSNGTFAKSFLFKAGTGVGYTSASTLDINLSNVVDTGGVAGKTNVAGSTVIRFNMTDIAAPGAPTPPVDISSDNFLNTDEKASNTTVVFSHSDAEAGKTLCPYRDGGVAKSASMATHPASTNEGLTRPDCGAGDGTLV